MSRFRIASAVVIGFGALGSSASLMAAPPDAPRLTPPGVQRGRTVEVKASGTFSQWPVRVWCDRPELKIEAGKDKGQFTVQAPADARLGLAHLRFHDNDGASNLRPFFIGSLPEAAEVEPNDLLGKAQGVDAGGVTVNGKLAKSGDIDGYAVDLKRGQVLIASVTAARALGSPMDGVLQIASADGFVLAQNDDDREEDPFLAFEAPADGRYVARIFAFPKTPDSTIAFAGGDDYVYRLTLTVGAFADHAMPLAVSAAASGSGSSVELAGWNLSDAAKTRRVALDLQADDAWIDDPPPGEALELPIVPHPVQLEPKPDAPPSAWLVQPPMAIAGRISAPREADAYRFAAKKGQTLEIRAEARAFGSPLDPALRIIDAEGKVIADVDDADRGGRSGLRGRRSAGPNARDAESVLRPASDGEYQVRVRDLFAHGSFRHVYLLTIAEPRPGFQAKVEGDRFVIKGDKPLDIAVAVQRQGDFNGEIRIEAADLPAGIIAEPVVCASGAASATLKLKTAPDLKIKDGDPRPSGPFRIVAAAAKGDSGLRFEIDALWIVAGKP